MIPMLFVILICVLRPVSSLDSVNFLFFGDWGFAGANQTLIADHMGEWSASNNANFLIALGDNFYKKGVSNDTDPLWNTLYSSVYKSSHLQIPWYAILGNHDYINNAEAQIDYYKNKRDSRWIMPDHVYNVIYPIGDSYPGAPASASLEIVFIDTSMIAPTIFGENITPRQRDDALAKVETLLAKSTATWLFVAGHYTIYSTAEHGNTQELITSLVPLLKKYKVHAYLNGHDHLLQHILVDDVHYITSGRGSLTDNYPANEGDHMHLSDKEELKFRSLSIGFNSATVTATSATIRFHNSARGGAVDFTYQLSNPRTAEILEDSQEEIENQEKRRHLLRTFIIGVLFLIIGFVSGVFAPTSLRVTLSKWCCGGHFKFCERKLSGDSLNTMVPVTDPTETSVSRANNAGGTQPWTQRVLSVFTDSIAGSYGRVDTGEHGIGTSGRDGLELGPAAVKTSSL